MYNNIEDDISRFARYDDSSNKRRELGNFIDESDLQELFSPPEPNHDPVILNKPQSDDRPVELIGMAEPPKPSTDADIEKELSSPNLEPPEPPKIPPIADPEAPRPIPINVPLDNPREFRQPEKILAKPANPFKNFIKLLAIFILVCLVLFAGINFPAFKKEVSYFFNKNVYSEKIPIPTPNPSPKFDPSSPAKIVVAKIGVDAPIIWNVPEDQVDAKLLEGVVHYGGTVLPGQIGNVFLIGHSSYYSWASSPYKDVFALLEKIEVGDEIYIQYAGANFKYVVTDTKTVSPNEISAVSGTNIYNLSLMTCVPVGTSLNRFIVNAKQVDY